MKRFLSLITLIILTATAYSQVQWQEDGKPVRQGVNIEWSRAAVPLGSSIVYSWSDTRRGDRDLFAQKVEENGNLAWGDEGIMINGEIDRQEDVVLIEAGDGGVIFAWVDFRNEEAGDVYAQKVDADGSLLWTATGLPICTAANIQISLNIVNDGNGGAYIIWQDKRSQSSFDIYGTHVLADGSFASGWEVDGNPIVDSNGTQNKHTFWEAGDGNALVAWIDSRDAGDIAIYIQKILSDGTMAWGEDGKYFVSCPGDNNSVKIVPDQAGNFYITWRDKTNDNNGDILAQKIDISTGDAMWANNVAVYQGDGIQVNPRMKSTTDNCAIIAWEDGRNSLETTDIYAQKIDNNGNLLWDADGVAVVTADLDQENPRLNADDNGGVWITWDDLRTEDKPFGDIYFQHLDANGGSILTAGGAVVNNETNLQTSPLVKISENGKIFVSWGDNRTGSTGINFSIFNSDGSPVVEDNEIYYGLSGDAVDFLVFENGSQPVVVWKDTRNSSIANRNFMQIINSDGTFAFETNGIPLTPLREYDQDELAADLHGDKLVASWTENRDGVNKIYAQAMSLSGSALWGEGIAISSANTNQYGSAISKTLDNNDDIYYIGWTDYNQDPFNPIIKVAAQKVVNGSLSWGNEGITIGDTDKDDVLSDVVGRFFIWEKQDWMNKDIYVKLVNEDGTTAAGFDNNGTVLCNAQFDQTNAKGMMIPEGLLVIWEDFRAEQSKSDIYAQIVKEDGTMVFEENGISLANMINDQTKAKFIHDGNIVAVWEDFRDGNYDVYIQKFSLTGSELWTSGGINIMNSALDQRNPSIAKKETKYNVFWEDYSDGTSNIKTQLIDENGEKEWDADGIMISDQIKNQKKPNVVAGENGFTYVFWEDSRSSGKTDIYGIYAQKIEAFVGIGDEPIVNTAKLLGNYPNPFNPETKISFELSQKVDKAEIVIFNSKGATVYSKEMKDLRAGTHSINFQAKGLNSGVYFCKLKVNGIHTGASKLVLLK